MASTERGSIVSFSPGRMRVRLNRPYRTTAQMGQIKSVLDAVPGIRSVEMNLATGGLLIHYRPDLLEAEGLARLAQEYGISTNGLVGEESLMATIASSVIKPEVARSVAIIGAAVLGGRVAPVVGLSGRLGSLVAAFLAAYASRRVAGRSPVPPGSK